MLDHRQVPFGGNLLPACQSFWNSPAEGRLVETTVAFTKLTLETDEDWTTLLPFALLQVSNDFYVESLISMR